MLNTGLYLQVQATWPVLSDDQVNPLERIPASITLPDSVTPLQPVVSILFNHGIDPAVYASDTSLDPFIYFTSLTDPSATNITQFTNVQYAEKDNLLVFQPAQPLTAGSRYSATVRSTLRDAMGRGLLSSYTWEFDVSASSYVGVPEPELVTPTDLTVVSAYPFTLTWGHPQSYLISTGCTLQYIVTIYSDIEQTQTIWQGVIPDSQTDPVKGALRIHSVMPAFPENILSTPSNYYWGVVAQVLDSTSTPVSTSPSTRLRTFLFSANETNLVSNLGGDGGTTFPEVLQKSPLFPPDTFRIISITPYPGYVVEDFVPIG